MIFFKNLPTDEAAVERLFQKLKQETAGEGPCYTDEELRNVVDKGCVLAIATLRGMDDNLKAATQGLDDADSGVVQSVALSMMGMVIQESLKQLMIESFLKALFNRRPS